MLAKHLTLLPDFAFANSASLGLHDPFRPACLLNSAADAYPASFLFFKFPQGPLYQPPLLSF